MFAFQLVAFGTYLDAEPKGRIIVLVYNDWKRDDACLKNVHQAKGDPFAFAVDRLIATALENHESQNVKISSCH